MQKVTLLEAFEKTTMTEIFCESWSSWQDGDYMCFLFLDVQEAGSFKACRTVRYTSRVVLSVTCEKVE